MSRSCSTIALDTNYNITAQSRWFAQAKSRSQKSLEARPRREETDKGRIFLFHDGHVLTPRSAWPLLPTRGRARPRRRRWLNHRDLKIQTYTSRFICLETNDARVVAISSSTRKPSSCLVGSNFPRSRQEKDQDGYIALLEAKLTSGKKSENGVGHLKDIEDDGLCGE